MGWGLGVGGMRGGSNGGSREGLDWPGLGIRLLFLARLNRCWLLIWGVQTRNTASAHSVPLDVSLPLAPFLCLLHSCSCWTFSLLLLIFLLLPFSLFYRSFKLSFSFSRLSPFLFCPLNKETLPCRVSSSLASTQTDLCLFFIPVGHFGWQGPSPLCSHRRVSLWCAVQLLHSVLHNHYKTFTEWLVGIKATFTCLLHRWSLCSWLKQTGSSQFLLLSSLMLFSQHCIQTTQE